MSYWTHINEYWIINAREGNPKIVSKAYVIILTENDTILNGFNYYAMYVFKNSLVQENIKCVNGEMYFSVEWFSRWLIASKMTHLGKVNNYSISFIGCWKFDSDDISNFILYKTNVWVWDVAF